MLQTPSSSERLPHPRRWWFHRLGSAAQIHRTIRGRKFIAMNRFLAQLVTRFRRGARVFTPLPSQWLRSADQMRALLHRERARAVRSGEEFSLLVFTLRGGDTDQETTWQLANTLTRRLRCSDEPGWL